jgi:DNA-binding MurR/RpiR family transcriptional regulator
VTGRAAQSAGANERRRSAGASKRTRSKRTGGINGWRGLEEAVSLHYAKLAPSQRRVIDTLISEKRYAAYSASDLARELGVNESTVTRAAQRLGFAGYPDMRTRLRDRLSAAIPDRVEASVEELGGASPHVAVRAIHADIEAIRATLEELVPSTLAASVEALARARTVYVFGSRGSYGLAEIFGIGLRLLRTGVFMLSQTAGDLGDQLIDLGSADALVAISFRRIDRVTVGVVQQAATGGATTIVVTDHRTNPVARLASHTLIARLPPLRLLPSYASGASLVHALLTLMALRLHKHTPTRLRRAERLWGEFGTHVAG